MELVIVDTAQIQPYIFGSNRLRENVGASHLVAQATEAWALEAVRSVASRHNVNADGTLDNTKHIEDAATKLDAEVFYAGGGNFVVLFRNAETAKVFTGKLSRKALTEAPNLQLVIAQQEFDWNNSLCEAVKTTFKKLAEEKRARTLSAPLLGLGVTVMCRSTALPATGVTLPIGDDPGYPASLEILAKIAIATRRDSRPSEADERLREFISPPEEYDYPSDFDDLGGTRGERNYIAVVHADGNGIGQRIMDIGKVYHTADKNRDYINALRSFSDALEKAAQAALRETLTKLLTKIETTKDKKVIVHKNAMGKELARIELRHKDGKGLLPFRPIIFGGDDVTFVCDGRLGLSLTVEYLRQFEAQSANLPDGRGKATACAGIAIVKTHHPFARAYALVDELAGSAKAYRRRQTLDGSCLDWHFALSGLLGALETIREREYRVSAGWLTLRPVTLEDNPKERHRAWEVVRQSIEAFQGAGWAGRRNKVKALRDALREGGDAVEQFRIKFNANQSLPEVCPPMVEWKTRGWQGGYCGYFDAIELADWFIPLTRRGDDGTANPFDAQK